MTAAHTIFGLGTALAGVGIWWLLPGSSMQRRVLGGVLTLVAMGLFGSQLPCVGDWLAEGLFGVLATVTIVAAAATISFRNPVYCAIWFGLTLSGTAGLFLLAGAEFLAVATIVVYAGAILVTFLFVLMLSEPEGHASYDRHSWEAMISAFTGAVLIGILTVMIGRAVTAAETARPAEAGPAASIAAEGPVVVPTTAVRPGSFTISRLGAELFTRYLVAVEAAGALLFAALVGAAVIVSQGPGAMKRPGAAGQGGTANAS